MRSGWYVFFFQAEAGIRGRLVTGVQTCALPILAVVAKKADAEARARLWNRLVAKTPIYKRFQDRTSRQIPVVYLMPVDSGVEA